MKNEKMMPEQKSIGIRMNIPSRQEIIDTSHLSPDIFDEHAYHQYELSLEKRQERLMEQAEYFSRQLEAIKPHLAHASNVHKQYYELTNELVREFGKDVHNAVNQKDLFPIAEQWFLVEEQIEELAIRARDLKFALMNVYSMGAYQSISLKTSGVEQIGPGQYARQETATVYGRYDLSPRQTEERFNGLLPERKGIYTGTLLLSSGMAALTTSLALTKAEKPNGTYAVSNQLYFENDHLVEHLMSEVGVERVGLFNSAQELHSIQTKQPDVIFFEPIANEPNMTRINVAEAIRRDPSSRGDRLVLVDYTLSGENISWEEAMDALDRKTILVLVTSLQKAYEEGDDVAAGGMLHVIGKDKERVENLIRKTRALRSMLGTTIPPTSLLLLSEQSIDSIKEHSQKIGQNVQRISEMLRNISSPLVERVVSAPDSNGSCQGLVFYVHFRNGLGSQFIDSVIREAKEKALKIVDGSSFGFKHMRMTTLEKNIVRIAPGLENPRELALLEKVFAKVLRDMGRN